MHEKPCTSCKQSKPHAEFNVRRASADGLQNVCRSCNRARARRYYAENREAHVQVIVARKANIRRATLESIGEYLAGHPCIDCGERDLRVLDFDHREGASKSAEVMKLAQHGYALHRVMAEIAKCDVRCRNCHAKVTYDRMGANWRSALMGRVAAGELEAVPGSDDDRGPGTRGSDPSESEGEPGSGDADAARTGPGPARRGYP
ncbi:hypothetical protein [Agromyces sp. NPDC058110]|uniref:hypothetical protein n=1 Tax=Agromyces sp. NPDC058110 TaxID=3346345 RepID=UPI0036DE681D